MIMVAVKALGGTNYVRAEDVMAVQTTPTGGAIVVMKGGVNVQSSEPAKDVASRIEEALKTAAASPSTN
jgi:hypothetical protein